MKRMLVLLLLITSNLFSQSKDTLNDVTVISIRADKKTPVTQKIVYGKDIQKTYQGQEVPYILNSTPSIVSRSDGGQPQGYTYFTLRGIDQSRVNMTLNGVPLNEPEDQGVYTSNYPGFTNFIQSMQIQRGVGTSTNGVASYAGSINFQSKCGLEKESEALFGYGSFNTKRLNLSYGSGLTKDKFSLFGNLSLYSSDGYRYNSGGTGFSTFLSGGHFGKKDIFKFTAFTGRSINQMAWLPVSDSAIKIDSRTNANANDASDDFKQSFIQVQYVRDINNNSKLSTSLFYNRLDGEFDLYETNNKSENLSSNFYGIVSNYQLISRNIKLNIGINLNKYNRTHGNSEDHLMDYGIPRYKNTGYKNETSTFVKLSYDIKKITFFGDIQYRYVNFEYKGEPSALDFRTNWNFINPKVGIIYTTNNHLNYYLTIGNTKREPNRTDLLGGNDNISWMDSSSKWQSNLVEVKNEEVTDFEIGLNLTKSRTKIQTNIYYMDFSNAFSLSGYLSKSGLPIMVSIPRSFRTGFEFDINHKSLEGFVINTNICYSYNKVIGSAYWHTDTTTYTLKNTTPLFTPDIIINQTVGFEYDGLMLSLNGKYHSKSYMSLDNKFSIPEFVVFGANISKEFDNKYTFMLQANNLLDNTYYTGGGVVGNQPGYFSNPKSNFYLTIKIKL